MPIDAAYARREALFLLQEDLLAKIAETKVAERAVADLADGAVVKAAAERPRSFEAYLALAISLHSRAKAVQLQRTRLAMENNRNWYRNCLLDAIKE